MAGSSSGSLSELYVDVVARGIEKCEKHLNDIKKKVAETDETTKKAKKSSEAWVKVLTQGLTSPTRLLAGMQRLVQGVTKQMSGLTSVAQRLSFGGSLGIGGIMAGAARGTVEAQRFQQSLDMLLRTVGDRFAPYMRMATLAIQDVTGWFASLDQGIVDSAAKWAVIGTAVAGFVATLPVLVAGFGAVLGAVGAILSPVGLAIGGIGLLIAAGVKLFNSFQGGGADMANAMNDANRSWLGAMVNAIGAATVKMAEWFNWVMQQAAKASDWIAEKMADVGESVGILPKGTGEQIRKMDKIQPIQVDVKAVDDFFKRMAKGADGVAESIDDLLAKLGKPGEWLKDLKNRAGDNGFRFKMDVGFEGAGDTWRRLQKGLADRSGVDVAKAQLAETKQMHQTMQGAAASLVGIKDQLPLVR